MKIQMTNSLAFASLLFAAACGAAMESSPSRRAAERSRAAGDSVDAPARWSNGRSLNGYRLGGGEIAENGLHINGMSANGMSANGLDENGMSANGFQLNGIMLEHWEVEKLHVEGSQMSAYATGTGEVLSGAELVGAVLEISYRESGTEVPYLLRIDGVELDERAVTPDVYLYSLSYRRPGDAGWRSVCTGADGAPEGAIPMEGFLWDPTTARRRAAPGSLTLACRSGAIGSCASWGYRPWIPGLVEHHQACIFMKRADYCGDGNPRTVDGTMIDIYDHLAPQVQTKATGWPIEAHWGTQGANCVSSRRHPEIPFSGQCLRNGVMVTLPACREHAGAGDLLSNGAQPRRYR